MKPPLVLTLDIGTSSTRAILLDGDARPVPGCAVQALNHMRTSLDGGSEFDPAALLDGVISALDQLLEKAGDRAQEIGGVAMDTFVTNMMGVDVHGTPLTPLYTYADIRSGEDAQALRRELGEVGLDQAHNRTGCLTHTAYWPPRLRWIARTRPDLMRDVARWTSIGEYLLWTFSGQWAVSYSVAAWTGLLNRLTLTWDHDWLELLSVDESHFSPLVDLDQPVVGLKDEWARRWPSLAHVPWFPAIGDGAAANIGSGCDSQARIALTIGTTGAMRVVVDPYVEEVPDGLWMYRVDGARGLLGGATTEGGSLFAWFRQTLQLPPAHELEQALSQRQPAAHGLIVLPFIGGERAPGWQESARATFSGLSLHTRPIDIVQAGLEGIAYRFAIIYDRILPHLEAETDHQIIASGGGLLSSPAWLQIMADVLDQPVVALAEMELTSRGTTLLALESLGVIEQPSDLPPETGRIYHPIAEHHRRHQAAIQRQAALYTTLYA